jgi:hypothetical protein
MGAGASLPSARDKMGAEAAAEADDVAANAGEVVPSVVSRDFCNKAIMLYNKGLRR